MIDTTSLYNIRTLADLTRAIIDAGRWLDPDEYFPNDLTWHTGIHVYGVCHVCDAGALLARHGAERELRYYPEQLPDEVDSVLSAADSIRAGRWTHALFRMRIAVDEATAQTLSELDHPRFRHYYSDLEGRDDYADADIWERHAAHLDDLERRILPAFVALGI